MGRITFGNTIIASAGYNARYALLEIEFSSGGKVVQYMNVPEEIWYRFRYEARPEIFFHRCKKGCYKEKTVRQMRS